ncbi:hypothetical protein [Roseofilum capinflatum]|uniref:Uncharacterized protein n=1 Tax=Roseofilum capinflatum BLCC-M114 TaxID=3022440 RepID=A0ABT7B2M7_9CYAN|nr:hypothetical protein [Roseofilum capinflatum]MDJ1172568.1 hypothetical protein [Roseofilum capinflatum BLCC-M114]
MRSPEMPRPIAPTQDAIAKRNGVLSPPQPLLQCDRLNDASHYRPSNGSHIA